MKIVVTLPTYNEAENITDLISRLLALHDSLHVLVIDDNSPDGTGRIVDSLKNNNNRIHIIHRTGPRGRGIAGIEGFIGAIKMDADIVFEMDSDFSHNPSYIPQFLKYIGEYDVVIGSRFIRGGGEEGRSSMRRWTSILANFYIRTLLGFPVRDCSSGYRCFTKELLEKIDFDRFVSVGPSIVSELLFHAVVYHGASVKEIPILFEERRSGDSKLNLSILVHNLLFIFTLFLKRIRYKFLNRRSS